MYTHCPENPEGTQVIVGSMNMGYMSDRRAKVVWAWEKGWKGRVQCGHGNKEAGLRPAAGKV